MRELLFAMIVIIIIFIVILILSNKTTQKDEVSYRFKTKSIANIKVNSIKLLKSNMNDTLKAFTDKMIELYPNGVFGIKNYVDKFEWEFYTKPNNNINLWYKNFKELFPNDEYDISLLKNIEYISHISFDVNEERILAGKTPKLNIYYNEIIITERFALVEYTFKQDNSFKVRGQTYMMIPRDFGDESIKRLCKSFKMTINDMNNIIKFVKDSDFNFTHFSITNKISEPDYGIYFTFLSYNSFIRFVNMYKFGSKIIDHANQMIPYFSPYVSAPNNDIFLEIGFYFAKGDNTMKIKRTAFYGNW